MSATTPTAKRDQVLSPRQVEGLIAQGQTIVVYQDHVLRLDSWLSKHPGGRLAILHMVGRDATDEMMAYHFAATLQTMKAFRIGRKPMGPWINMKPPIRGGVYRALNVTSAPDGAVDESESESEESVTSAASSPSSVSTPPESVIGSVASKTSTPDLGLRFRGSVNNDLKEGGEHLSPADYTTSVLQANADNDIRDFPEINCDVQQDIISKYRVLHQRVIDEGLYQCNYVQYGKEMMRYTTLFSLFAFTLHHGWYTTSAVFLGLFWHQIMFTAHDAGHRAITGNFVFDTIIGIFIADFCCGLSIGWWKSSHNVHHLITNHPEHDPDIQNVPLFATCPRFFRSIVSSYYDFTFVWDKACEKLVPYQKYTYYPIMAIARFNLYLLSWMHVLSSKSSSLGGSKAWWVRPAEIVGMACYWFLFGYCLVWCLIPTWTARVIFVLVSHIVLMPLHVQINLSHWGMSTSELGETESFPQRQMRTTMDVDCPEWLDWAHGGLQFQVVHHLFPRMPRHNLRKGQVFLKEFSASTNIPYSLLEFVDSNIKVLGRLSKVSDQVKILVECQKNMAETGEMGFH